MLPVVGSVLLLWHYDTLRRYRLMQFGFVDDILFALNSQAYRQSETCFMK